MWIAKISFGANVIGTPCLADTEEDAVNGLDFDVDHMNSIAKAVGARFQVLTHQVKDDEWYSPSTCRTAFSKEEL